MPATQTVTIHLIDGRKIDSTSPVVEGIPMDTVINEAKTILLANGYTGLVYQIDVTRDSDNFMLAPVMQDGRWLTDDLDGDEYEARMEWAFGPRPAGVC